MLDPFHATIMIELAHELRLGRYGTPAHAEIITALTGLNAEELAWFIECYRRVCYAWPHYVHNAKGGLRHMAQQGVGQCQPK